MPIFCKVGIMGSLPKGRFVASNVCPGHRWIAGALWLALVWGPVPASPQTVPSSIFVFKVPDGSLTVDGDLADIASQYERTAVLPTVDRFNARGDFGEFNVAFYDLFMAYDNNGLYFGVSVSNDDEEGLSNDDDTYLPLRSDATSVFLDPAFSRTSRPHSTHANFTFVAGSRHPQNGVPIPLAGEHWLRVGNGKDFGGVAASGHPDGMAEGDPQYGLFSRVYTYEGFIAFSDLRRRTGLPIPVPRTGDRWGIDFRFIDSEALVVVFGRNGRLQVWAPANRREGQDRATMERIAESPANWGQMFFLDPYGWSPPILRPEPPVEPVLFYHAERRPEYSGWFLFDSFPGAGLGYWEVRTEQPPDGPPITYVRLTDNNQPTAQAMAFGTAWSYLGERGGTLIARMRLVNGRETNSAHVSNAALAGYDEYAGGCALSFRSGSQAVLTGPSQPSVVPFPLNLDQWHTWWMVYYPVGSSPQAALYVSDASIEIAAWQPARDPSAVPQISGLHKPAVMFGSTSVEGTIQLDLDWLAMLPSAEVFDRNVGGFRAIGAGPPGLPPTTIGPAWMLYE